MKKLKVKTGTYKEFAIYYEVHYFLIKLVGGEQKIQDPDHLIYDISWVAELDLENLILSFPEDRHFLLRLIQERKMRGSIITEKWFRG
ncbi:NUDIX hydrolase [Evansella halocellulosilytica]|uniref:hypothetical protein n=1 Tax=Evansella halocellulosilytica TaxID=2011013 RepID=UPI000BB6CF09